MPELMSQGLDLAIYGMGTVFFFLTLLVFATMVMSALVPDEIDQSAGQKSAGQKSAGQESAGRSDPKILAAIAAAIHQYRTRR